MMIPLSRIYDAQAQFTYALARAASAPSARDRQEWMEMARGYLDLIGELLDLAEMEDAA